MTDIWRGNITSPVFLFDACCVFVLLTWRLIAQRERGEEGELPRQWASEEKGQEDNPGVEETKVCVCWM